MEIMADHDFARWHNRSGRDRCDLQRAGSEFDADVFIGDDGNFTSKDRHDGVLPMNFL